MTDATAAVEIPDGITPVVGWRVWRWPRGAPDGRLGSINYATNWDPHVPIHATCGEPGRFTSWAINHGIPLPETFVPRAPVEECRCGVYALMQADEQQLLFGVSSPQEIRILGRVALWGKVVAHDNLWRGEFAYPQALYVPDAHWASERNALAMYGVPVLRWSEQPLPLESPTVLTFRTASIAAASKLAAAMNAGAAAMNAGAEPPRRQWYLWPVRAAGTAFCAAFAVLQLYGVVGDLWWGATGGSELRQALGVVTAMVQSFIACWYIRLALRAWRWRPV